MVGGGLMAIVFLCALVCWVMWSLIYFTFASHYFLTTLTDSSAGQDEIHYPREGIMEWWWKPVLFTWALLVLVTPTTLLLSPLAALSPTAFLIAWSAVLWFVYPLMLASMLYSQNWLVFIHRQVVGRMLRHFGAFIYVHVLTFAIWAACVWLMVRGLTDITWLIGAVLLVPAAQLLYARHWGRFAWLSLNFLPRQESSVKKPRIAEEDAGAEPEEERAAEPTEPEPATGMRAGLPPNSRTNIQAAPPAEEVDEWTDMSPYAVHDDPTAPSFEEKTAAPPKPVVVPSAPVVTEEEDEWATNKKPYGIDEPAVPVAAAPLAATAPDPEANDPQSLTQYYGKRAKREAVERRKAEAAKHKLPPRSKKTPTFQTAFLAGVWNFMFYPSTLMVWANLAVFTLVEFLLLYMMMQTFPFREGRGQ